MSNETREIRFERLRPAEINMEMARCPIGFLPIGPLEYHGPHMPVGTDPLIATACAMETCARMGKGVVFPTLFWGTERERPTWMLESLGLPANAWVVGMDFPTALWKSHYSPEHIFGLVVATQLDMFIAGGYRVIVIVNGHGATNHQLTLERLAKHYSHTTPCLVAGIPPVPTEPPEEGFGGHADLWETSIMLHNSAAAGRPLVDLGALPARSVPIHYHEFSVVDGRGFSKHPDKEKIVRDDPRNAKAEDGKRYFEEAVAACLKITQAALKEKGLA